MKPICHVVYSAAMIGKQFIQKSRLSVLHKLIFAVTSRPIFCAAVYCTLFFTPLFKLVTTIWTRIHRTMVGKRDFRSYLPMFMEISFICALIIHYMYLYSMFTQCFVYSKFLLLRSVATLNPRSGVSVERCIKRFEIYQGVLIIHFTIYSVRMCLCYEFAFKASRVLISKSLFKKFNTEFELHYTLAVQI